MSNRLPQQHPPDQQSTNKNDNNDNNNNNDEIISIMSELSEMLGCGLDEPALKASLELLDSGVNPGALATAILELRKQK